MITAIKTGLQAHKMTVTIIGIIGILLAGGAALRWYGNAQWSKGVEKGRQGVADQIIKDKEQEWAERDEAITAKNREADRRLTDIMDAAKAVQNARTVLMQNFDVTLKEMEVARVEAYRYAGTVADADLISELRAVSRELANPGSADGDGDARYSGSTPRASYDTRGK